MIKITEVEKSVLNITNEKRPKIRPSSSEHTKTKGILVREIRNCVLGYGKQMTGRLKKERIKKDVRYQESREVTLEWWDYNYHSRVTSFLQFAQNKSHSFKKKPIHLNFNINYFLRLKSAKGGFLYFYVAF